MNTVNLLREFAHALDGLGPEATEDDIGVVLGPLIECADRDVVRAVYEVLAASIERLNQYETPAQGAAALLRLAEELAQGTFRESSR